MCGNSAQEPKSSWSTVPWVPGPRPWNPAQAVPEPFKGSRHCWARPSVLAVEGLGSAQALTASTRRTQPSDCLPGPTGPGEGSRRLSNGTQQQDSPRSFLHGMQELRRLSGCWCRWPSLSFTAVNDMRLMSSMLMYQHR